MKSQKKKMDKSMLLQEVVYASADPVISRKISELVKEGHLAKIAPRVYTSNLEENPEAIVRRNLLGILGQLYPGVVLSHRSAFEFKPTETGNIFLTTSYTKKAKLPGVTINFIQGPPPTKEDRMLTNGLYVATESRALLENFQSSRKPGPESKTLTIPEIEEILEKTIRINGEKGLNELRDKSRDIANELGMEAEFHKLNKIVSALLRTNDKNVLHSAVAQARSGGSPYDPARLPLFEKLYIALKQSKFEDVPDRNQTARSFRNFAFFEAYFSNYIEGTEFGIEDAKRIIETKIPMPARNEDSHDVLGTYEILSNRSGMRITPASVEEMIDLLQQRHKILMSARPSKKPGEFKDKNNRAGNTYFVDYLLVRGTLAKGFDYYRELSDPFAKAVFMMFMISEVHPFLDGNGRVARVMMNAELTTADQAKIIIPTVYREDYMGALKQFSKQQTPEAYIRMLHRAQQFSRRIIGDDMDTMQHLLEECRAFDNPEEAKLKILTESDLPPSLRMAEQLRNDVQKATDENPARARRR